MMLYLLVGTGHAQSLDGRYVKANSIPPSALVNSGTTPASSLYYRGDGTWQSITAGYTLPIASSTVLGGVKIGSGIMEAGDGTISVTAASSGGFTPGAAVIPSTLGLYVASYSGASMYACASAYWASGNSVYAEGGGELRWQYSTDGTNYVGIDGTSATYFLTKGSQFWVPHPITSGTIYVRVLDVNAAGSATGFVAASLAYAAPVTATTYTGTPPVTVTGTAISVSAATTSSPGVVQVGSGLSVVGGVLSANAQTATGAAGGDLTGTYPNPTLAAVGAAGTYGDSTHYPIVTTNSKGQVTNVTTQAVSGGASFGSPSAATGISVAQNTAVSPNQIHGSAYNNSAPSASEGSIWYIEKSVNTGTSWTALGYFGGGSFTDTLSSGTVRYRASLLGANGTTTGTVSTMTVNGLSAADATFVSPSSVTTIPQYTTDPSSPAVGTDWINTTTNYFKTQTSGGLYQVALSYVFNGNPQSISGLELWLKADSITGVSNGSQISSWSDSSGVGNNASQSTSANQPTYVTNVQNGQPGIRFSSSSSSYMTISDSSTLRPANFTVFAVFASSTVPGYSGLLVRPYYTAMTWSGPYVTWGFKASQGSTSQLDLDVTYGTGTLSQLNPSAADITTNRYYIATGQFGPSTSLLRLNGSQIYSSTSAVGSIYYGGGTGQNIFVGAQPQPSSGSNGLFDGTICELLFYNTALSSANISNVESYLDSKYAAY